MATITVVTSILLLFIVTCVLRRPNYLHFAKYFLQYADKENVLTSIITPAKTPATCGTQSEQ